VIGGAVSLLYNSTTLVTQMVVLIGACLLACVSAHQCVRERGERKGLTGWRASTLGHRDRTGNENTMSFVWNVPPCQEVMSVGPRVVETGSSSSPVA